MAIILPIGLKVTREDLVDHQIKNARRWGVIQTLK
jgi:hypothetical protein